MSRPFSNGNSRLSNPATRISIIVIHVDVGNMCACPGDIWNIDLAHLNYSVHLPCVELESHSKIANKHKIKNSTPLFFFFLLLGVPQPCRCLLMWTVLSPLVLLFPGLGRVSLPRESFSILLYHTNFSLFSIVLSPYRRPVKRSQTCPECPYTSSVNLSSASSGSQRISHMTGCPGV